MFKKRAIGKAPKRRELPPAAAIEQTLQSQTTKEPPPKPVDVDTSPKEVPPVKTPLAKRNDALHQTRLFDEDLNSDLSSSRPKTKFGPKSAASNIRSSTAIDYQPDVCKEYKLTGYCGYGDSCKFLHAREDYAAGWQLDQQWDADQKKEQQVVKPPPPPQKQVCGSCKKDPVDRVKLKCDHVYCEQCFLGLTKKSPKCLECNAPHNGSAVPF